jgi:hypothetical protein
VGKVSGEIRVDGEEGVQGAVELGVLRHDDCSLIKREKIHKVINL